MNSIGVDVDSKYLVCCVQRGDKRYPLSQFDNDPPGFRKFIKWAMKRQQRARVTMEAELLSKVVFDPLSQAAT